MEKEKKRRIEEQLRQLLMLANRDSDAKLPEAGSKPSRPRVIRRRKGTPDLLIA